MNKAKLKRLVRDVLSLYWEIFNPPAPRFVARYLPFLTRPRENPFKMNNVRDRLSHE